MDDEDIVCRACDFKGEEEEEDDEYGRERRRIWK